MAKVYKCRASSFFDFQDPVVAYYFDRAVYLFGMTVDGKMDEAGRNAKGDHQTKAARQRVLDQYLKVETKGRFADPVQKKAVSL